MKTLLRQFEVCERLGIHPTTWIRWRANGLAPRPVNMPGAKRWTVEDIEAFASTSETPRRRFLSSHLAPASRRPQAQRRPQPARQALHASSFSREGR